VLVVDAHAHIVPREFPTLPTGVNLTGWPSMVALDDGRARMMIDGNEFRVIQRAYFDLETRLQLMDHQGIGLQVVSPLPELLGHWLDARTALELATLTNTVIAEAIAAAPARIAGLGMLPLQDPQRSAAMVSELAAQGLRGIEVGSNVNGRSIADPCFDGVLAELARHGMALFVHGSRPAGMERLLGPRLMINVVGIPQDTAMAIASFIVTDVLSRHPGLKLGFSHGGGTFGAVLDRMDFVWHEFSAVRATSRLSPREYVRKFYFDTVTYSVRYLRYLIDAYGEDALICGTDGPDAGSGTRLEAFVSEACGTNGATPKILATNAARFFNLTI
jgi:aminocarboxymuconate-semialdehyde decarboxylase